MTATPDTLPRPTATPEDRMTSSYDQYGPHSNAVRASDALTAIEALASALIGDQTNSAELPALLTRALGRPVSVTYHAGHAVRINPTGPLGDWIDTARLAARLDERWTAQEAIVSPPAVREAADRFAPRAAEQARRTGGGETSPQTDSPDPAGDCASEPRSAARDASEGQRGGIAGQVHQ